jgi:hypothetical protein
VIPFAVFIPSWGKSYSSKVTPRERSSVTLGPMSSTARDAWVKIARALADALRHLEAQTDPLYATVSVHCTSRLTRFVKESRNARPARRFEGPNTRQAIS